MWILLSSTGFVNNMRMENTDISLSVWIYWKIIFAYDFFSEITKENRLTLYEEYAKIFLNGMENWFYSLLFE